MGLLAVPLLPLAIGFGVLKYRLYDIDVVINKTVVFGALAAFITAVYVGIVVGIGAAIGQGSKPNLGLSILATGVVAVAFQPVRERVQRFANHLVYGVRATPYEVLSEFSSRMAGTYTAEDLPPRMAQILAEGTGSREATVWLKVGGELRAEASWPAQREAPDPLALADGELPEFAGTSLSLPVHHRGELLGALTLSKHAGERLTPAEHKLASDLASQAGLVLRNVRLTEELLARLEELQASRQRIVAAQDAERRKLERNIHDGAQQQLVALSVKIRLARQLGIKDPGKASELLEQTEAEVSQALEDIRDLARGIYPPLLADQGLVAALSAQARRSPVPVQVEADGIGRYPRDAEAAVYFCCLEALQNVAKYAGAASATVRLRSTDEGLAFEVSDDGAGFDMTKTSYGTGLQGIADRLAALGGVLAVRSSPGSGTAVAGTVPLATSADTDQGPQSLATFVG
jgi:signal transduction histidine kinase